MMSRDVRRLAAVFTCVLCMGPYAPVSNAADYTVDTVAEGLSFPWALAFLPGGDILVTEREGRLRIVRNGQLDPTPISGVPETFVRGQGGLMDLRLHPNFPRNQLVYLSYSHGTQEANALRVARARLADGALHDLEVIYSTEPLKDTPIHYGARLAFMPDGTLLITTGDGFLYREKAQVLDGLLGKTVRLRDDGSIPEDNPFFETEGVRPEIWTYGHRNPQGLLVDAGRGRVYLHEHGPMGGDEINILEPGKNYGWPIATYGLDYTGARISPYTEWPGSELPLVYWVPSIAPSGIALYNGEAFPEWQGDLFVGALAEQSVRRIDLQNGQVIGQEVLFTELEERIREVRVGPDGYFYLLTDNVDGRLLRIRPQ